MTLKVTLRKVATIFKLVGQKWTQNVTFWTKCGFLTQCEPKEKSDFFFNGPKIKTNLRRYSM